MNLLEARALARKVALHHAQHATDAPAYLPQTDAAAATWTPHDWVLDALCIAAAEATGLDARGGTGNAASDAQMYAHAARVVSVASATLLQTAQALEAACKASAQRVVRDLPQRDAMETVNKARDAVLREARWLTPTKGLGDLMTAVEAYAVERIAAAHVSPTRKQIEEICTKHGLLVYPNTLAAVDAIIELTLEGGVRDAD